MDYLKTFKQINTFIFDIDGVLTTGDILFSQDGMPLRRMSIKDGFALKTITQTGKYHICLISGAKLPGFEKRFMELGISDVYQGTENKFSAFQDYISRLDLDPQYILYMGDDLPDYEVMRAVKLPCCPKDAVDEIRDISKYISPWEGGKGCVRDVIEKVLKLKGDWPGYPTLSSPK